MSENRKIEIETTAENLPSPKSIQRDIYRLLREKTNSERNIEELNREISRLREEQSELRVLVLNPGFYEVPALEANIKRIDDHIVRIRATIIQEQAKADHFDYIIEDLEQRKLLSESTSAPPVWVELK